MGKTYDIKAVIVTPKQNNQTMPVLDSKIIADRMHTMLYTIAGEPVYIEVVNGSGTWIRVFARDHIIENKGNLINPKGHRIEADGTYSLEILGAGFSNG